MSRSRWMRVVLPELLGTAVLVAIGTGTIVAGEDAGNLPASLLAIGWFFAVLLPVLLFARISGAHLNPAVTTALAASGRLRWAEWPYYVAGQLAGAFAGSLLVLALLGPGVRLGANVPASGYLLAALPVEAIGTALLVATVFLIADRGEGRLRWRLLLPAIVVAAITFAAGLSTGVSLNPARSLAPAAFSGSWSVLWIYVLGPTLGALLVAGAWRLGNPRPPP